MKSIFEFIYKNHVNPQYFTDNEIENIYKYAISYKYVKISVNDYTFDKKRWQQLPLSHKKEIINDLIIFLNKIDIEKQDIANLFYENYDGQEVFDIDCNSVGSIGYICYLADKHTFYMTTKLHNRYKNITKETNINVIKTILQQVHL